MKSLQRLNWKPMGPDQRTPTGNCHPSSRSLTSGAWAHYPGSCTPGRSCRCCWNCKTCRWLTLRFPSKSLFLIPLIICFLVELLGCQTYDKTNLAPTTEQGFAKQNQPTPATGTWAQGQQLFQPPSCPVLNGFTASVCNGCEG